MYIATQRLLEMSWCKTVGGVAVSRRFKLYINTAGITENIGVKSRRKNCPNWKTALHFHKSFANRSTIVLFANVQIPLRFILFALMRLKEVKYALMLRREPREGDMTGNESQGS